MAEPKIVFCKFNHIYDAAINSECPYCRKIKEDQAKINKDLDIKVFSVAPSDDDSEEEKTEYIVRSESESKDFTELLNKGSRDKNENTEILSHNLQEDLECTEILSDLNKNKEEYTDQLSRTKVGVRNKDTTESFQKDLQPFDGNTIERNGNSEASKECEKESKGIQLMEKSFEDKQHKLFSDMSMSLYEEADMRGPVLGWIVCNSGKQMGRSFEIVPNRNYICINAEGVFSVERSASQNKVLAEIEYNCNRRDFSFLIEKMENGFVNDQKVQKAIIHSYDSLVINSMEFVFVELISRFVNWG